MLPLDCHTLCLFLFVLLSLYQCFPMCLEHSTEWIWRFINHMNYCYYYYQNKKKITRHTCTMRRFQNGMCGIIFVSICGKQQSSYSLYSLCKRHGRKTLLRRSCNVAACCPRPVGHMINSVFPYILRRVTSLQFCWWCKLNFSRWPSPSTLAGCCHCCCCRCLEASEHQMIAYGKLLAVTAVYSNQAFTIAVVSVWYSCHRFNNGEGLGAINLSPLSEVPFSCEALTLDSDIFNFFF